MARKNNSEVDESTGRGGENSSCPDVIIDKAREVLEYDNPEQASDSVVRAHNQGHDCVQGERNHLIRTDTEWIAIRTWRGTDGETGLAVEDYGDTLDLEWLKFDLDSAEDQLRSEAHDALDKHETSEDSVEPLTTLIQHAEEVTRDLVSEWGVSAEMSVRPSLTAGVAGWTGRVAWTDELDQAIYDNAHAVARRFISEQVTCDVNDDVEGAIHRICVQVLSDAVDQHRDGQTRSLTYAAEVTLRD
jgi:hypothetical protein